MHRAREQGVHFVVCLVRAHPEIIGSGILLVSGADKREVLDPGNVIRIREMQIAVRIAVLIQFRQCAAGQHFSNQPLVFRISSGAPVDGIGLR